MRFVVLGLLLAVSGCAAKPTQITILATNERGTVGSFTLRLTVAADTQAPTVSVTLDQSRVNPGDTVEVTVRATDNIDVSSLTLTANGIPVTLDSTGHGTVTATTPGGLHLVATATDPSGNVGTANATLEFSSLLTRHTLLLSPSYSCTPIRITKTTNARCRSKTTSRTHKIRSKYRMTF